MFSATLRRTEHRRRPLPAHLASHPLGNLAPSIGECPRISTPPRLTCPYAGVELPTVDEVELVDEVLDGALDPTKRRANWSTCRAAHFLIRPPQLRPDCARELVVRPHHRRTHPASVIVLKPTLRENPRPPQNRHRLRRTRLSCDPCFCTPRDRRCQRLCDRPRRPAAQPDGAEPP